MAKTVVLTTGLSKWFGQVIALNDVNVQFKLGITGLLGPNGAGKSTLLRLIAGQLKPSLGDLSIWGQPVWNNPALFQRIGFCMDTDGFYWGMTGLELVQFLARLSAIPSAEQEVKSLSAIESVGLTEQMHKKIGAYSKGMRQRLKLAQVLVHDPDLVLLDEPLNGMDPIGRSETINLIHSLGEKGHCVVVSSHVLHEVEALTDNILLMHQGNVVAEGRIPDIRDLIDEHPHKIFLHCDNPRLLASICVTFDDVTGMQINDKDDSLTVETRRPDEFYARMPRLVIENEISIYQMYSPDNNLQSVFKYLIQ